MSSGIPQKALTVKELRDILGIGANSAYVLLHSKAFPVIRIGRSYRIPREPFNEWMTGRAAATQGMKTTENYSEV
jgi:excisionase family DNA binding protein